MFDRIAGDIVHRSPTRVVVMTAGVGYEIEIPVSTYEKIPDRGAVEILTHLHVREDQLKIFGFATARERSLFRLLISISGVGPKLALTVLSGSSVSGFVNAVGAGDIGFLSSVKGIGKKRAQRMVLELKDSVADLATGAPVETVPDTAADAVEALVSLGYTKQQAEDAVRAAVTRLPGDAGVEDVVRSALSGV